MHPASLNPARAPGPAASRLPSLSYHAVRLRWSAAVLRDFIRRWGIYVVVGGAVLSGSASAATTVAALKAMAAGTVLPLFEAAGAAWWVAFAAAALHSLAGVAVALALQPILWNRHWADIERALPIGTRTLRLSDMRLTCLALSPLFGLYAAGALTWLGEAPAWLAGRRATGLLLLACSASLSVAAGTLLLGFRRRTAGTFFTPPRRAAPSAAEEHRRRGRFRPLPALYAVTGLVMVRPPHRRVGHWLAGGCGAVLAAVVGLVWLPSGMAWWLGALSAASLIGTSRLWSLAGTDLRPMHELCAPLPVSAPSLLATRRAVALLPATLGLLTLAPAALFLPVRPAVLAAYAAVATIGNLLQVLCREERAMNQVSRWLLTLVLLFAVGSEVHV